MVLFQPMLDTVKMNPSLVTASKDNETTTARFVSSLFHQISLEILLSLLSDGRKWECMM